MSNPFFVYTWRVRQYSVTERMLFAKQLSFLLNADVPILESLGILRAQTTSIVQSATYSSIIQSMSNGQPLSASIEKTLRIRDDFFINIIRIGEQSGSLAQNLHYLSEELQKKQRLRKKVQSALIYPLLICISMVGIAGVLLMYVFPKILPIFQSLKIELPLSTRILILVSNGLLEYWPQLLLMCCVSLGAMLYLYHRHTHFRSTFDSILLHTPYVAPFVRSYTMANCCRALQLLLVSGMRLPDALVHTERLVSNRQFKVAFLQISESVSQGGSLAQGMLQFTQAFPPIAQQLIAVGERVGTLPTTLGYLSNLYEVDLDEQTKNLANALEPALMIIVGVLVGFVAMAIISPMYTITAHVSGK